MKKVLLGLTLLASMSSFSSTDNMSFECEMIDYENNATQTTAIIKKLTISSKRGNKRWFKPSNARDVSTMCAIEDESVLTCEGAGYALEEGQELYQVSRAQKVTVTTKIDLLDIVDGRVDGTAHMRKWFRFGNTYDISCNVKLDD